jgi:hypothetical protein
MATTQKRIGSSKQTATKAKKTWEAGNYRTTRFSLMQPTRKIPTLGGWYWAKHKNGSWVIVLVDDVPADGPQYHESSWINTFAQRNPKHYKLWFGPLKNPEESSHFLVQEGQLSALAQMPGGMERMLGGKNKSKSFATPQKATKKRLVKRK